MKKYSITVLCLTTLLSQSLLYGDSKYERLLADIDTQNLPRLKKNLQDDEYLSPEPYKRLIDEAKEIHERLQKKLSIWSDPRDLLVAVVGAVQTAVCSVCCLEMADMAMFKRVGERSLIFNSTISSNDKELAWGRAIFMGFATFMSGAIVRLGYSLKYGRMQIVNAKAIVWALEAVGKAGTKGPQ